MPVRRRRLRRIFLLVLLGLLLLAAVLAGAVIFEGYSPFGVALVGAAGSGLCGGAALLGACFGYLCQMGFADGLRYASASILTFAVAFAFYDLKAIRRSCRCSPPPSTGRRVLSICPNRDGRQLTPSISLWRSA